MDDLINQIVEKTGVTAAQARDRATMALAWMKDELPADVGNQIGGLLDGAGKMASGMVDRAKDAGSSAGGIAGDAAGAGASAAAGMFDKAKDSVSDILPGGDS